MFISGVNAVSNLSGYHKRPNVSSARPFFTPAYQNDVFIKSVRESFAMRQYSETFEWSIRQRAAGWQTAFAKQAASSAFKVYPSFTANTSAGNILKKLIDIICPYTGVKMIRGSEMTKIEKRLDKCDTAAKAIKVLAKYTDYMQETELKMFDKFAEYAVLNPKKTFTECLQDSYNESLTKLKLEEFFVLDDVDIISRKLSADTALALRSKTTRCRQIILENKEGETFKRKTLLASLDEIELKSGEDEVFERLKDKALYLPTSGSSENAFAIKYATRSHAEIAKRLLRASVATIEHIEPDSLGGGNILKNFMLASANANSYRSNMPLTKYIDRFPNIPKYCQMYIEQIIQAIHKGKLQGCQTYPYDVTKTLEKESGGRIMLDLSSYKYTEEGAKKRMGLQQKRPV